MGYSAPITAATTGLFGRASSVPTWRRVGGALPYNTPSFRDPDGVATCLSAGCFWDAREAPLCLNHDFDQVLAYAQDMSVYSDRDGLYFVADVRESQTASYNSIASGRISGLSPATGWKPWHASQGRDGIRHVHCASLHELSIVEEGGFPLAGVIPVDPSWDSATIWRTLKALPGERAKGRQTFQRSSANYVDHDARTIYGMVLAEQGPLKSKRGEFDEAGLETIADLINAAGGVESYWTHDHVFDSNNIPVLLGMITNARVDRGFRPTRLRGDLKFFPSASRVPGLGDVASYVMQRAEERPEAISSSLVFYADLESRQGKPPLLRPTKVLSSDIVGDGDAVSSLLSRPTRFAASFDSLSVRKLEMRRRSIRSQLALQPG